MFSPLEFLLGLLFLRDAKPGDPGGPNPFGDTPPAGKGPPDRKVPGGGGGVTVVVPGPPPGGGPPPGTTPGGTPPGTVIPGGGDVVTPVVTPTVPGGDIPPGAIHPTGEKHGEKVPPSYKPTGWVPYLTPWSVNRATELLHLPLLPGNAIEEMSPSGVLAKFRGEGGQYHQPGVTRAVTAWRKRT